jgi:hypothetical protein
MRVAISRPAATSLSRAERPLTEKREIMKISIAIGLVVAAGVALAACGSDDGDSGGTAVDCAASMQKFSVAGCDAASRSCYGATIPASTPTLAISA